MVNEDILSGLARILVEVADIKVAEVTPEKTFGEDLGVDSLMMIEIVVAAEDTFNVRIRDDDIEDLNTVADAIDYIQRAPVAA